MKNTFRVRINNTDYTFYRTIGHDDAPSYFILFGQKDKRTSVKVEKDLRGSWYPAGDTTGLTGLVVLEFIRAITENETQSSPV